MSMQAKYGNYIFTIDKTSIGYILNVSTADMVPIVSLKMSRGTLQTIISIIESVALGTESNFTEIPMADPTCKYIFYMYHLPLDYDNIGMLIYKQPINGDNDIMLVKTKSHIDSGEIDGLFQMLVG